MTTLICKFICYTTITMTANPLCLLPNTKEGHDTYWKYGCPDANQFITTPSVLGQCQKPKERSCQGWTYSFLSGEVSYQNGEWRRYLGN